MLLEYRLRASERVDKLVELLGVKAMSSDELCKALICKPPSVRDAIYLAREQGYPIVTNGGKGYKLASKADEMDGDIKHIESQMRGHRDSLGVLKSLQYNMRNGQIGQASLFATPIRNHATYEEAE